MHELFRIIETTKGICPPRRCHFGIGMDCVVPLHHAATSVGDGEYPYILHTIRCNFGVCEPFRDYALDGQISYRRALAYSWYTFVYASLIFALAQYLYIRFYDSISLVTMMSNSIKAFGATYEQMGINETQMQESAKLLTSLTPMELTFLFFTQNVFIGCILSLITAAFGMKRSR